MKKMAKPVFDETFIDDGFLRKLEKLKLLAKKGFKGPEKGEHRARQTGEGLEFLDYRKYHLGDDLRYLDWSVYGRLDRLFIKLFHAEENQTIHMLIDMSRSMAAGTPPKQIRAKKIAAAIGYICLSGFDRVGVSAFGDTLGRQQTPARGRRRFPELLGFLSLLEPAGATDINGCLTDFAAYRQAPGIVIVLSDLFDPNGCRKGLQALVHRRFEVHLVQILDSREIEWTAAGSIRLNDVETGRSKTVYLDSGAIRQYRAAVDRFITDIRNDCAKYGIHHYVHNTRVPFEDFLMDYLTTHSMFRAKP